MITFGSLRNARITTKFIIWFLFISLLPLALATYISYTSSRTALENESRNRLFAAADNKAYQIEVFLREKERSVSQLSLISDITVIIEKLHNALQTAGPRSEDYRRIASEYTPLLTYHQKSFGYNGIILLAPDGTVIFSHGEQTTGYRAEASFTHRDSYLSELFERCRRSLRTEVSPFHYDAGHGDAIAYIAAPVLTGGNFSGAVVARISNTGLSEVVGDYEGLGDTGETAIVSRLKDRFVFITPLRFSRKATLKPGYVRDLDEKLTLEKAVGKKAKLHTAVDYRDREVLSTWTYVPGFDLALLVKMDTSEVFSSARRVRMTLVGVSSVLLVLVVILAVLATQSITKNIRELTRTSRIVAEGDLTARAQVDSQDEIGELAHSFNTMTDSLVEAKAAVEQKKSELESQKRLLESVNKELDSFVYTASHDLRAPLRGISSFASFLEEDYKEKLDAQGKEYIQEIKEGALRMNALIDDLLTLSRISRIQNPYEDVSIAALIMDVKKRIDYDLTSHNVDFVVGDSMPVVRCDRIKMSEVFLNLINNAVKFSSKNREQRPRVEVGYSDEGEMHRFFVKDNGIGIDPKYHEQIFGIFRRLHNSEEYEGTGAGLSIVKRIIDSHEGSIWIESKPGEGATFFFTIPKSLSRKKRIGEILVEDGLITDGQLKERLERQKRGEL